MNAHRGTHRPARCLAAAFVFFLLFPPLAAAQLSYDPYAPIDPEVRERHERSTRRHEKWGYAGDAAILPLDAFKAGVEKTLTWVERYHIDDKVRWAIDWIEERGFKVRQQSNRAGRSFGAKSIIDVDKVLRYEERVPELDTQAWASVTLWPQYQDYGGRVAVEMPWVFPSRAGLQGRYEVRPEDPFWGIGPTASLGDGTNYKEETTGLEVFIEADLGERVVTSGTFALRNVNITDGEDGRLGQVDAYFHDIHGTEGAMLLSGELAITHDDRNSKAFPTSGGTETLSAAFVGGVDGADTSFFRYRADVAHYFRLFKDDRALAVRTVFEHNDEVSDNRVPFFELARMGGVGTAERSDVHRGYVFNRFFGESLILFNVEYRYTVCEYRNYAMDVAPFADVGQIFDEISSFDIDRFTVGYGLAIRLRKDDKIWLSMDIGHSDEGTKFFIKSRTPF